MAKIKEIARKRRSIRKYKTDKFGVNAILECIDVAKEAPSGSNAQPWHFVIVEDDGLKKELREVCEKGEKKFYSHVKGKLAEWLESKGLNWQKPFLTDVPYIIAVFSHKKSPYSRESVWIAVGYLILAIEEKGLASLTYTPPNRSEVAKLLNCPEDYRLEVLIPVGYAGEDKVKEPRKGLDEIVSVNRW
ncbi:nitroreductase family protein [Archaeoglobales archaeon]|nr:MAG: nitroreductase family protein [Archaeoglobales archaeon]